MMQLRVEPVPLLLGYILGSPSEEYFRRTLLLSKGDAGVFLERPISATALGVAAFLLAWSIWSYVKGRNQCANP